MLKRYNRNEPFRYEFGKPIRCEVLVMNEPERVYDAEVINMSPKGVQLYINKNVLESDRVKAIKIKVQLNSNLLLLAGEIVWRKNYLKGLLYGVSLEKGDTEQIIIEELKKYSKSEGK